MSTRDPLGGEDMAWLHMERPNNPMVVDAVVELAAPLAFDAARPLFERLLSWQRFRSRLVEPRGPLARPAWVPDPDFDLARHVERVELDEPGPVALREAIGAAVSRPLDPSRPLWKVVFIDRPAAGTTLLFRVHHAIADGFALLGVLDSVCDGGSGSGAGDGAGAPASRTRLPIASSAKAIARLVTLPADPETRLKRPVSADKRVAWSKPIALGDVKAVARSASATVNDVLVAVVAGALRRTLGRMGDGDAVLELHAMVPVNLRPARAAGPAELGNRFGLVVLGLPIGVGDPVARVRAVAQRMRRLKATPEAAVAHGLLRALGRSPRPIEDAVVGFFAKKTSLVLTNVPGPRAQRSLAGVPITRIVFWVPQAGPLGLGISIFSYAGEVTVGVLADAAVLPYPDAFVADLHAEMDALTASASSRASTWAASPA